MRVHAPAKLNLCLYLGPRRDGGLHELRSLVAPLELADRLHVAEATAGADEVVVPGIPQPDLVAGALAALRRHGWGHQAIRVEVDKKIPAAAGLGGGSADAAAVLRLAREELDGLGEMAVELGADVLAQLEPGFALVGGAGERVEPLPAPPRFGVVLITQAEGLSTADVYAEADRLGLGRELEELDGFESQLRSAASSGGHPLDYADLLVNDLQAAALSLRPEIEQALDALAGAGARSPLVTGSGPTAFGLFPDHEAADRAASELSSQHPGVIATAPLTGAVDAEGKR